VLDVSKSQEFADRSGLEAPHRFPTPGGGPGLSLHREVDCYLLGDLATADRSDNLWYVLEGSISTGHSTRPGGAMERARLSRGRTPRAQDGEVRGTPRRWERTSSGRADTELRGVLWGEPGPEGQPGRAERAGGAARADPRAAGGRRDGAGAGGLGISLSSGDARAHPRHQLPAGGEVTTPVPPEFQGSPTCWKGEATFGANRRRANPPQLVLLGPGEGFTVTNASPGLGTCSWRGSCTGRLPCSTGRS